MRILKPEAALKLITLAGKQYRPPQIIALKEKIDSAIRALELKESVTGSVPDSEIQKIVDMKLELDCLCADWAEGRLS